MKFETAMTLAVIATCVMFALMMLIRTTIGV